jgi:hypothetical protein
MFCWIAKLAVQLKHENRLAIKEANSRQRTAVTVRRALLQRQRELIAIIDSEKGGSEAVRKKRANDPDYMQIRQEMSPVFRDLMTPNPRILALASGDEEMSGLGCAYLKELNFLQEKWGLNV